MNSEKLYLRHNVVLEPLINQWYAWSYLIPPATAAMYMAQSHFKIMQSFITTPQVHIAALKNPDMLGGPFINYDSTKISEIKELMERTTKENAEMLKLAEAIKTLEQMLTNEAKGYSIEPIYQNIPEVLKGYVELVYDLNNNPSIRLIEGLLYKSQYYNPSCQSIAIFVNHQEAERPFAFSTPRLEGNERLHLKLPFNSEKIDELWKMKDVPNSLNDIKERLGIENKDEQLFSSFFTTERPQAALKYAGNDIRVRYFGHACVLIESKDVSILCDPVISYQHDSEITRYTYADLPETIDYILITHNHQDHCLFETLLQLRHKTKNIIVPRNNGGGLADPSLKLILQSIGFQNVIDIDDMETICINGGDITGLPFLGEHADLNVRSKSAYLVNLEGRTVLLAADSNNIESKLYQHIYDCFGNIDVLFLGMECDGGPLSWLYGPLLTNQLSRKMDQSRRLDGSNYVKAIDIVNQLNPKQVYVYAMGQEPWLTFLTSIQYTEKSRPIVESNKLVEECKQRSIIAERLFGQKEIFLN